MIVMSTLPFDSYILILVSLRQFPAIVLIGFEPEHLLYQDFSLVQTECYIE